MSDGHFPPTLDTLNPQEIDALRAKRAGPRGDQPTEAERAAIAKAVKAKKLRPGQARARLKEQERRSRARLGKNMILLLSLPPAPAYFGPPVRAGFDAEWVTLPDGNGGWRNEVLCIAAVIECGGRYSRHLHRPRGPMRADRPTMAEFVQKALRLAFKEGTVPSMPAEIVMFGHFIRGDLASFGDFWAHKREFRGLGKTIVSGRAGHALDLAGEAEDGDDPDGETSRRQQVHLRAPDGRRFRVRIRFVDTIKLTPGQRGLAYVGKMNGMPKLDLHDDLGVPASAAAERPECVGMGLPARYGKDRMDLVMRDFPELTQRYAFRDAEIALDHGIRVEKLAREQFGLSGLPSTLAGCAAGIVRNMSGGAAALAELVGRTTASQTYFDERKHTYRTVKRDAPSPGLDIFSKFASDCYHGGRNECFYHGPTDVGAWYDYDLPGAYTTALVALRPVDYDNIRQELNPDSYGIDDLGLAWVSFEFPPGTRFPCLPVRGAQGGLFFPMAGRREDRVFVGAPEIFLARRMGAAITVIQGFKAPWKSDQRIFEPFTRLVQTKRREFPKATDPAINELWKEVGNSAYGLMAQGLKAKNAFDPRTMRGQPIGQSPLTEPFLAAWTTSFIRAVLGEILAGVPAGGTVVTATTDGLLTDVPLDRLKVDGPLCTYFADIRERLFGAREVLDPQPKHGARQLISVAVRTTFTALRAGGLDLVCAKGSVKPPTGADPVHQNRHMVRLYLKQHFGMKVAHEQLISAREQLTHEADLHGLDRERVLNLRYDFKRRPVRPRTVRLGHRTERIAWDTVPWRTIAEAEFARVRVDGWSRERERVLRSMDDYRDWEAFFEASVAVAEACAAAGARTVQVRRDNAWGILKRVFLQAGRQGEWGIAFERRGLASVAAALTAAGFPTGKEDITYAGRRNAPLLAHCVPWVPETEALLRVILQRFPDFQYQHAFRAREPAVPEAPAVTPPGDAPA